MIWKGRGGHNLFEDGDSPWCRGLTTPWRGRCGPLLPTIVETLVIYVYIFTFFRLANLWGWDGLMIFKQVVWRLWVEDCDGSGNKWRAQFSWFLFITKISIQDEFIQLKINWIVPLAEHEFQGLKNSVCVSALFSAKDVSAFLNMPANNFFDVLLNDYLLQMQMKFHISSLLICFKLLMHVLVVAYEANMSTQKALTGVLKKCFCNLFFIYKGCNCHDHIQTLLQSFHTQDRYIWQAHARTWSET